ncbi:MAG: 5'-3' exonuclease [Acidimicrobiales bacterium]
MTPKEDLVEDRGLPEGEAIADGNAGLVVCLVDGTYELFRHHYGQPERVGPAPGVVGVLGSILRMLESGVTHLAVATDAVVESFRNQMWPTYKSSQGMDPEILGQFGPLDQALTALGVKLWAMVAYEADDALAAAAAALGASAEVGVVQVMTPDKDLAQCVRGARVVQVDRRRGTTWDEDGVRARYGVGPASIPDWLALVGDSSDGFPGLAGWGPKTASAVLGRYGHLEAIPTLGANWDVEVRGAAKLAGTLAGNMSMARLFRDLATLRTGPEVIGPVTPTDLLWTGPQPGFAALAETLGAGELGQRAESLAN